MAQFDVEVKNSIRELQTAVSRLEGSVTKTNSSLRTMSREAAGAAKATGDVAKNVQAVGKGAGATGTQVGGMMRQFSGLAAANPALLAVGFAIGAITDKVQELIQSLIEAQERKEALQEVPGRAAAAQGALESRTARSVDVGRIRRDEFSDAQMVDMLRGQDPETVRRAMEAANIASESGMVSRNDALSKILDSGMAGTATTAFSGSRTASPEQLAAFAAGFNDVDVFNRARSRFNGSATGRAARRAELLQSEAADAAASSERSALLRSAGFAAPGNTGAAIEADPQLKAQFDKLLEEQKAAREALERIERKGGFQFSWSRERAEQSYQEAQLRVQQYWNQAAAGTR